MKEIKQIEIIQITVRVMLFTEEISTIEVHWKAEIKIFEKINHVYSHQNKLIIAILISHMTSFKLKVICRNRYRHNDYKVSITQVDIIILHLHSVNTIVLRYVGGK